MIELRIMLEDLRIPDDPETMTKFCAMLNAVLPPGTDISGEAWCVFYAVDILRVQC